MRYPNVHNALNRILRSEVLYLFFVTIGLYYGLLGSWGPLSGTIAGVILSWVLRACCIVVAILRITALGQGALDEDTFRSAQRLSLIYLLLCVLNTVFMPYITNVLDMLQETGELQQEIARYCTVYLALFMMEIAASFSSILSVFGSLARIALREKLVEENDQIQYFKLLYGRLILCAFAFFGLKILIPGGMLPGNYFSSLLGIAILAAIIAAWWFFLCFLQPMSEALLGIKWKEENQWNGVARELCPDVLDLYDPDAAVHAPPEEPRLSWKPEAPWKGVAKELLPESAKPAAEEEAPLPGFAAKPVKPPRSIWEFDVERFFKDRDIKLTKEDEATKDLRYPNVYRGMKYLIRAERVCLASLLCSFFLFLAVELGMIDLSYGTPLQRILYLFLPATLLGRIAALMLWRPLLWAPLDEITFLSSKKLLVKFFYSIPILFVAPCYLSLFSGTYDYSYVNYFLDIIWIFWGVLPFPVALSMQKAFVKLAEKLGEWDWADQWHRLHRRSVALFVLIPVAIALVVLLNTLLPYAYTFNSFAAILLISPVLLGLAGVWYSFIEELIRAKQTLEKAKIIRSSAEFGAGIDYAKDRKPEAAGPKPYE